MSDPESIGLELGETSTRCAPRCATWTRTPWRAGSPARRHERARRAGRARWRRRAPPPPSTSGPGCAGAAYLRAELRRAGDELVVATVETTLRLPRPRRNRPLRRLLAGEELTVAELGGDGVPGDADRLDLAASLLRHALVVPA